MPMKPEMLRREINDRLPADINIRDIREVPQRFHARHHAEERFYLYQITTRRRAFGKHFVWWVKDKLNLKVMAQAAALFIGKHDFLVYCDRAEDPSSTVVVVTRFELLPFGDLVLIRMGASHFLWKMVRRVVGTLVELGRGNITLDQLETVSASDAARWTAPPSGLFLEYVRYAGDPPPDPIAPAVIFR